MTFDDFSEANCSLSDFSGLLSLSGVGVVYVFFCEKAGAPIPFYVGETDKLPARMGDYCRAGFAAPTDFKVGEAARYLNDTGYRIVVKYKETPGQRADRCKVEKAILQQLRNEDRLLLNDLSGYDYHANGDEERDKEILEERATVRKFCDEIVDGRLR